MPTGRLATYYQNDDDKLDFFLNDHLGNARVIVDDGGQTQYYAYYPFGELIESSGSHGTEFQFTAKERDEHGNFELDYFGARYYDHDCRVVETVRMTVYRYHENPVTRGLAGDPADWRWSNCNWYQAESDVPLTMEVPEA